MRNRIQLYLVVEEVNMIVLKALLYGVD